MKSIWSFLLVTKVLGVHFPKMVATISLISLFTMWSRDGVYVPSLLNVDELVSCIQKKKPKWYHKNPKANSEKEYSVCLAYCTIPTTPSLPCWEATTAH